MKTEKSASKLRALRSKLVPTVSLRSRLLAPTVIQCWRASKEVQAMDKWLQLTQLDNRGQPGRKIRTRKNCSAYNEKSINGSVWVGVRGRS